MKNLSDHVTFRHGATINNRMVQAPMLTNSGKLGEVSYDTIKYWRARRKSAGMMITGYNYVSENGGPAYTWADDRTQLAVYDKKFVPELTKLAKTMKKEGNKAILQIVHDGREANYRAAQGKTVYGPDTRDYSFLPYHVEGFTTEQIDQVVKDFGSATKRAIDAGFDGVEIHGANHYLIQQFFSTFSNHRADKWGKHDAFAMAVAKEVFEVVKKYAPKDFIVGYRISPEEINPGTTEGYTWHESTKLIKELNEAFDFDYIHLSLAKYNQKPSDSDKTFAEIFKPVLDKDTKLIIVGDVMSAAAAEDALKLTDLVAVGRAQLIDSKFCHKVVTGHKHIKTELTDHEEDEEKLTPGLREVLDKETKRPNWQKKLDTLKY